MKLWLLLAAPLAACAAPKPSPPIPAPPLSHVNREKASIRADARGALRDASRYERQSLSASQAQVLHVMELEQQVRLARRKSPSDLERAIEDLRAAIGK